MWHYTIFLWFLVPPQCHFLSKILEGMGIVGQDNLVLYPGLPNSSPSCQPTLSHKFHLIVLLLKVSGFGKLSLLLVCTPDQILSQVLSCLALCSTIKGTFIFPLEFSPSRFFHIPCTSHRKSWFLFCCCCYGMGGLLYLSYQDKKSQKVVSSWQKYTSCQVSKAERQR